MTEDWKKTSQALHAHLLSQISQLLQPLREQDSTSFELETYRATFAALANLQTLPREVGVEPLEVAGLAAEWLLPPTPVSEQVILYFHGGTYIDGSLDTDRVLASRLAGVTRTKVLQIAYRLAPEHPFPTAIHDGLAAYQWLLAQGYSSAQVALAGSGAGGGMTLAVLLSARDQGYPLPVVAACLSPWLDLTPAGLHAKRQSPADDIFTAALLEYAAGHYLRPEEAAHPLASPLYADVQGMPPLFLQVGQHELLCDDALQFARRVRAANVRARCISWGNMFHGWQAYADVLPAGQLALEQIAAYFEKYFALTHGTWSDTTETWSYEPYPLLRQADR